MSNVHPIRRQFDRDVDTVIFMVNGPPTEPDGIPFDTLLVGPASQPDPETIPEVPWPVFGIAVASFFLGVLQTLLITQLF